MDNLFARWIEHNSERPAKWQIFKMRKWKKKWKKIKTGHFTSTNLHIIWPRQCGKTFLMHQYFKEMMETGEKKKFFRPKCEEKCNF